MELFGDITILEMLSKISGLLTLIIVAIGLLSLYFNRKQIHFNTMTKCIDEYRKIVREQQRLPYKRGVNKECEKFILVRDHLGLVNEELFYMQMKYLHKDISTEWINNMLDYIPVKQNGKCINEDVIRNSKELQNLSNDQFQKYINEAKQFNKIDTIFRVNYKPITKENKYLDKNSLITEILNNIKYSRKINKKTAKAGKLIKE